MEQTNSNSNICSQSLCHVLAARCARHDGALVHEVDWFLATGGSIQHGNLNAEMDTPLLAVGETVVLALLVIFAESTRGLLTIYFLRVLWVSVAARVLNHKSERAAHGKGVAG